MAKRKEYERGFSAGSLAVIATLLRLEGWRVAETARDLLRDFCPDKRDGVEDDLAVLREFKLLK